ncbi:multidrug ABC transporter ATP-binding protein [Sulfodiicoccus acidiphilus]|uniref:Multidrug ABC transporter ATP-binding protein n=1 Tax=Sulfodiicoccus acidiphilus TaxID=1670455 RepID=A0A348B4L5_9CREN|nr:multidrug ABC transporter ATP-binding protein [Sulfodiicoccus acidiphilus]GGU00669.1 multidrug ABC transporter ATP-binding protein [Sulfodiicoccus acidiphilus]
MWALRDVNLKVDGSAVAVIGPNGAGKTTLIKVIATLVEPTTGDVLVNGLSVRRKAREVRRQIGLMTVSDRVFYFRLTGFENLVFYASLYDLSLSEAKSRARELISIVGLDEWGDVQVMKYSLGMMRRLALARALLHDPSVLLLDEPTLGVDVVSARKMRELVRELSRDRAVLFTSHYMKDVEEIASYIYVIKEGRIVESGTPSSLKSKYSMLEAAVSRNSLPEQLWRYVVEERDGSLILRAPQQELENLDVEWKRKVETSLEDVYVALVGEGKMDVRLYQNRRRGGWTRQ